jgi:hypothetical protein
LKFDDDARQLCPHGLPSGISNAFQEAHPLDCKRRRFVSLVENQDGGGKLNGGFARHRLTLLGDAENGASRTILSGNCHLDKTSSIG